MTDRIQLVALHEGRDSRVLDVELAANGDVVFSGQDLGPATAPVSDDGEYEYGYRIVSVDVPAAVRALGGEDGEQILDLLSRRYSGLAAFSIRQDLERAGIATHLWTFS